MTNSKPNITAAGTNSQVEGEPVEKKPKITTAGANHVEAAPNSTKPKTQPTLGSGHVEGKSGEKDTITTAGDNERETEEKSKTLRNKEKRMRSKKKKNGAYRKKAKRMICEVCGSITISLENYEQHIKNHEKNLEGQVLPNMPAKAFKSKYS